MKIKIIAILICYFTITSFAAVTFIKSPELVNISGNYFATFEISENSDVEVSIVNTSDSTIVWNGKDDYGVTVSHPEELSYRVRVKMSVTIDRC